MPIETRWEDDSKSILIFDLSSGDWTWEEYDKIVDVTMAEIKQIPHTVSVIIVPSMRNPKGSPVSHLQRVLMLQPPNIDVFVLVNANYFTRSINTLMIKLYPKLSKQLVFARTADEAHAIIQSRTGVKTS
jgi:hypothetical protein